jgi:hypothetical protein
MFSTYGINITARYPNYMTRELSSRAWHKTDIQ